MEIEIAILFLDIVDSTRLYERLGNVRATALTQGAINQLRAIVARHQGRVVKSLGDGLMCTFPSADEACHAGSAMIEAQPHIDVSIRIGVHYGPVVEENNDVFGDAINTAARVQSLAKPNELLITDDVAQRLSRGLRNRIRLLDSTTVKGKTVPIGIFQFRIRETSDDSLESTISGPNIMLNIFGCPLTLHVEYLGQGFAINCNRPKVTIGRDPASDIRILSKRASRNHGSIEFERESFLIRDHSSNGTFIQAGDGPAAVLRRDFTKLVGKGLIGFGAAPGEDDPAQEHVARFRPDPL